MSAGIANTFESYGDGGFRVGGTRYRGSLIVLPEICLHWPVAHVDEITVASLAPLWELEAAVADLLLIGGGARPWALSPDLRVGLVAKGLAVEPMDTGAACRTFNVLVAEQRRPAAAVLAVA